MATVLGAGAGGCADLPPIEQFACGNGVLEEGEACELSAEPYVCGAPETPQECRYLCTGGAPCPPGNGCGADGECRHGFDEFDQGPGSPYNIEAADFRVGDVDGDGFPDIVGFNAAGFTGRFGDESGAFEGELDLAIATTGLPGFGYFDGDGRLDVVAPTVSGILGFQGADDRTFDSMPFASFDASIVQIGGRVLPVRSGSDIFDNILLFMDNKMCHPNLCSAPPTVTAGETEFPLGHTADQILGQIPVADLNGDLLGPRDEFALVFEEGSQVYIYELVDFGGSPDDLFRPVRAEQRQAITVPGTVRRGVFFADVDSSGSMDLIIPIRVGPSADRVAIALGDNTGMFGTADVATWFNNAIPPLKSFTEACGSTPWPLAVGDLNGDFWPDYVGDRGVCLGLTGVGFVQVVPLAAPELLWEEAIIADFNGDGRNDVATTFNEIDGVDFYLGTEGLLFNRDHVDTDDPPIQLRVGDFDGDFFTDLAVIEDATLQATADHSLSVLFGRPDGAPDFPTSMARFPEIEDMQPLDLLALTAIDQITDMMVVAKDRQSPPVRSASLLFGDAEDQMLAPFFAEDNQAPFMAQIGRFSPGGDAYPDIVGMTVKLDFSQPIPVDLTDRRLVYLAGAEGGQFPAQQYRTVNYPAGVAFAESCSLLATQDLDGDGVDSIVAVDGSVMLQVLSPFCSIEPDRQDQPRLLVATLAEGAAGNIDPQFDVTELPGAWYDTRHLDFHDLNGDLFPEMIVTYGGEPAGTGAGVVAYWNHEGALSLSDESPITDFDGAPLGATALNTDGEAELELAVLTTRGIFLYRWDDTKQFTAAPLQVAALDPMEITNARGPARIIAADINRDGVDDLVATFGSRVYVFLAKTLDRAFVEEAM